MSVTPNFDAFIEYLKDTSLSLSDYKFNPIFIEISDAHKDKSLLESLILKLVDENIVYKDLYEDTLEGDKKTKKQQWEKLFYELQDRYFALYNKYFYDSDNIINGSQLLSDREHMLDESFYGFDESDFFNCITNPYFGPKRRKIIEDYNDKFIDSLVKTSDNEKLDFIILRFRVLKKHIDLVQYYADSLSVNNLEELAFTSEQLNEFYNRLLLSKENTSDEKKLESITIELNFLKKYIDQNHLKKFDDLQYTSEQIKSLEKTNPYFDISFIDYDGKLYDEEDIRRWTVFNDFLNYYSLLQDKYYNYSIPKSYYLFDDPTWDNLINRINNKLEQHYLNVQEFAILTRLFMSKNKLIVNTASMVMKNLVNCKLSTYNTLKDYIKDKPPFFDDEVLMKTYPNDIKKIIKLSKDLQPYSDYYNTTTRMINSICIVQKDKIADMEGIKKLFKIDAESTDSTPFNVFHELNEINT